MNIPLEIAIPYVIFCLIVLFMAPKLIRKPINLIGWEIKKEVQE